MNTVNTAKQILGVIKAVGTTYSGVSSILKNITNTPRDINIILGVRGRKNFIPTCIRYLKKSIENSSFSTCITLVEQDEQPNYIDLSKKLSIDYIFIPNSSIKTGVQYNRSFCFNAGFLSVSPSQWYLFHDIDLLVDQDFFEKIKAYLDKNPKWLQTYTKKRVLSLKKEITDSINTHTTNINFSKLVAGLDYLNPTITGSTGGSILVRRDIFMKVGGFDPELFYGYGPEDSFFWSKLEALVNKVDAVDGHFAGGGTFADDPAIELYHMYHESMSMSNPDQKMMIGLINYFWSLPHEEKLKVIQEKEKILAEAMLIFK